MIHAAEWETSGFLMVAWSGSSLHRMHEMIYDIALCIIAAWALGVVAKVLRQPIILAYLVAGFSLGPSGFGWVHDQESISTISELGLIFLLFMIGLEIDLKKIVSAGRSILITAASQILGGCILGSSFSGPSDSRSRGGDSMRFISVSRRPSAARSSS